MSWEAVAFAFDAPAVGARKLVLLELANCADREGSSFPSLNYLKRRIGMSIRCIRQCLRDLEEARLIATKERGYTSSIYTVLFRGCQAGAKGGTGPSHRGMHPTSSGAPPAADAGGGRHQVPGGAAADASPPAADAAQPVTYPVSYPQESGRLSPAGDAPVPAYDTQAREAPPVASQPAPPPGTPFVASDPHDRPLDFAPQDPAPEAAQRSVAQRAMEIWNEVADGMPLSMRKASALFATREALLLQAVGELGGLDEWRDVVRRLAASEWLGDDAQWSRTQGLGLEWLLRDGAWQRVCEGAYDKRIHRGVPPPPPKPKAGDASLARVMAAGMFGLGDRPRGGPVIIEGAPLREATP